MIELTRQYGRYGYRRVAALLRDAGWQISDGRVERLWRREGLKVPMKQPKRGRLWLNDGSCIRLRPEHRDHVWSYDFVHHRTDDGKVFRTLNILDEYSRECLAIRVKRKLNSTDVMDVLTDLFIMRGVPAFIRSDNGPEFIADAVRNWIRAVGAKTAYITPGSPWENGYCESFNARFRDELLERRNLLLIEGGTDHHRTMEKTLQHQETTQCTGLPPTGPGGRRADGPKTGHALTFILDHLNRADHCRGPRPWKPTTILSVTKATRCPIL